MTTEGAAVYLALACWARAAGLTREEASQLQYILRNEALPISVDQAWSKLDRVTMEIRRSRRREPPVQQAPEPWAPQQ